MFLTQIDIQNQNIDISDAVFLFKMIEDDQNFTKQQKILLPKKSDGSDIKLKS